MAKVIVDPQPTPNPNAMKFNLSLPVTDGGAMSFTSEEAAADHPLAARLFQLDGVVNLFFLGNFITVSKRADASWNELVPSIVEAIESELS